MIGRSLVQIPAPSSAVHWEKVCKAPGTFFFVAPPLRFQASQGNTPADWSEKIHHPARASWPACLPRHVAMTTEENGRFNMASKQTYLSGSAKRKKKKTYTVEKCSQDIGEVCFHDVGWRGSFS